MTKLTKFSVEQKVEVKWWSGNDLIWRRGVFKGIKPAFGGDYLKIAFDDSINGDRKNVLYRGNGIRKFRTVRRNCKKPKPSLPKTKTKTTTKKRTVGVYLIQLLSKEDGKCTGYKFGISEKRDIYARIDDYHQGTETFELLDIALTKNYSKLENELKASLRDKGWIIANTNEYISKDCSKRCVCNWFNKIAEQFA